MKIDEKELEKLNSSYRTLKGIDVTKRCNTEEWLMFNFLNDSEFEKNYGKTKNYILTGNN